MQLLYPGAYPDAKGTIREIVLPKGLDLDRPKRTRTSFTAEQLYRLELEFQRCQYVLFHGEAMGLMVSGLGFNPAANGTELSDGIMFNL
ncbi:hypothetical protein F7725_004648 [Dissostichus mawsoni]|uniref:Homeobox domain-containing protein n=1 Tax=Dissostichus mawsoni TaxID=36200 RepID=A0A7J5XJD8_DISMA|nr:hypothetical protein F7725_004648 [Dissostichus mawsoni]